MQAMPGNRRLAFVCLLVGAMATLSPAFLASASSPGPSASPSPSPSPSPSASPGPTSPPTPQVLALQAQVAAMEQQILTLQLQSAPLQLAALQAQQRAATLQQQLASAQVELSAANQRLARTTASLQALRPQLDADERRLAALIVANYKITSDGSALAALVNSRNLVDALDHLLTYQQVTDRMEEFVLDVHREADELVSLQASQRDEQQQIVQQVNDIDALQAQAAQDQVRYQEQAGKLTGKASVMTQQLDSLLTQLASAEGVQAATLSADSGTLGSIAGALPAFAFGPRVDDFPWGQCTWYVASLRDVTWNGDAWQWALAAAAQGKQEGVVPKPGAIVVFGPGNGYSDLGHVAYVETVTGPTSFTVDEANVYGLGIIDKRSVASLTDVLAFIYPDPAPSP